MGKQLSNDKLVVGSWKDGAPGCNMHEASLEDDGYKNVYYNTDKNGKNTSDLLSKDTTRLICRNIIKGAKCIAGYNAHYDEARKEAICCANPLSPLVQNVIILHTEVKGGNAT